MTEPTSRTLAVINSVAPIRICDNGGWTDTWFAEHGKIFNIGVYPYAEVQIEVYPPRQRRRPASSSTPRTTASAMRRAPRRRSLGPPPAARGRHRVHDGPATTCALEVTIFSEAPGGRLTGTSAAVTVALIGALDRLTPGRLTPHEVAYAAHASRPRCSSRSAASRTSSARPTAASTTSRCSSIPSASVSPIQVPNPIWWELERRLVLSTSASRTTRRIHEEVIASWRDAGPDGRQIEDLRATRRASRDAVTRAISLRSGRP